MSVARRFLVSAILASTLCVVFWLEPAISSGPAPTRLDAFLPAPRAGLAPGLPPRAVRLRVHHAPRRVAVPRRLPALLPLTAATTVLAYPPPPIQARAAYLLDMANGRVLYAKNADARLAVASTTKITTAVLALQRSRLSDLVTATREAATVGESTMELQRGERLTVRQLLYGMLLNSGNDAAVALAQHVAGTQARFARLMNRLAAALHLRNSHYVTPHGLDAPHQYSSAHDLAVVARYAMRDATFRQIVGTEYYHIPATRHNHEHWLGNVNRVMYWYPGVDGVKPGDTDAAGLCQVVSVNRDGRHLLAVLLNTPNLWLDIRNLLNFGLRDFRWVQAPIWSDGPASYIPGGSGAGTWVYYLGAGHYVGGQFLHYFNTHGGLSTLGYPRTEPLVESGRLVQYFQGGALAFDPGHSSVYPVDLGTQLGARLASVQRAAQSAQVAGGLRGLFKRLGGAGVMGRPLAGVSREAGNPVQYFEYGALALSGGVPSVVPLGDAALRLRGWLPAQGAADAYPASMAPAVIQSIAPPYQVRRPWTGKPIRALTPPALRRGSGRHMKLKL